MPMKDFLIVRKACKKWILPSCLSELYIIEADFGCRMLTDHASKGGCQQLPSQADAQERDVLLDRATDKCLFLYKIGIRVCVIHMLWTPKGNDGSVRSDCGKCGLLNVDGIVGKGKLVQDLTERSRWAFPCMLQYQYSCHTFLFIPFPLDCCRCRQSQRSMSVLPPE